MNSPFITYCCVAPPDTGGRSGDLVAHMAWSVGPGLALLSSDPGGGARGGLMVINDQPYNRTGGKPRRLMEECLYICHSLGFSGIICDFEQPVRPMLETFIRECAEGFSSRELSVYVPERYAHCHSNTRILIPTALTSGSLPSRLREAVSLYGPGRVALDMERVGRDLLLPNTDGPGIPLTFEAIPQILAARRGTSFFSGELGARYFTYKDEEGQTHFVIYDDPGTFRYKMELALQMGIREGFVLYPDMVGLGLL